VEPFQILVEQRVYCKLQYYFSSNNQDKYFLLPMEHKVFCPSFSIEAGLFFLLPMGPEG